MRNFLASALLAAFALTTHSACTNIAVARNSKTSEDIPAKRLPATFSSHNFGPYCFDTLECRIEYVAGAWIHEPSPQPALSQKTLQELTSSFAAIDNFPDPARVSWIAKDGTRHHAEVDIGNLFRDQRIVHRPELDLSNVDKRVEIMDPTIILVVDDRTISVYMKAFIPLIKESEPGDAHSNFEYDPVLVWSQTY